MNRMTGNQLDTPGGPKYGADYFQNDTPDKDIENSVGDIAEPENKTTRKSVTFFQDQEIKEAEPKKAGIVRKDSKIKVTRIDFDRGSEAIRKYSAKREE